MNNNHRMEPMEAPPANPPTKQHKNQTMSEAEIEQRNQKLTPLHRNTLIFVLTGRAPLIIDGESIDMKLPELTFSWTPALEHSVLVYYLLMDQFRAGLKRPLKQQVYELARTPESQVQSKQARKCLCLCCGQRVVCIYSHLKNCNCQNLFLVHGFTGRHRDQLWALAKAPKKRPREVDQVDVHVDEEEEEEEEEAHIVPEKVGSSSSDIPLEEAQEEERECFCCVTNFPLKALWGCPGDHMYNCNECMSTMLNAEDGCKHTICCQCPDSDRIPPTHPVASSTLLMLFSEKKDQQQKLSNVRAQSVMLAALSPEMQVRKTLESGLCPKCPSCATPCVLRDGCAAMHCTMCMQYFCEICRTRWNNSKKCHECASTHWVELELQPPGAMRSGPYYSIDKIEKLRRKHMLNACIHTDFPNLDGCVRTADRTKLKDLLCSGREYTAVLEKEEEFEKVFSSLKPRQSPIPLSSDEEEPLSAFLPKAPVPPVPPVPTVRPGKKKFKAPTGPGARRASDRLQSRKSSTAVASTASTAPASAPPNLIHAIEVPLEPDDFATMIDNDKMRDWWMLQGSHGSMANSHTSPMEFALDESLQAQFEIDFEDDLANMTPGVRQQIAEHHVAFVNYSNNRRLGPADRPSSATASTATTSTGHQAPPVPQAPAVLVTEEDLHLHLVSLVEMGFPIQDAKRALRDTVEVGLGDLNDAIAILCSEAQAASCQDAFHADE